MRFPAPIDLVMVFASVLFLFLPQLATSSDPGSAAPTSNNTTIDASTVVQRQHFRPVYLITQVRFTAPQVFPPTLEKLLPAWAGLHFNSTNHNSPLQIQLVKKAGQDVIRVTDWGLENGQSPWACRSRNT